MLNKLSLLLKDAGISLTDHQKNQLIAYVNMLHKWNKAYNLTSVRDPNEMLVRHILDSIVVAPYLQGERFIDVGTAATVAVWDPEYCSFSDTAPCFLLPSQPPSHFNPERATFYRDKPDARALAWYLPDSYLCVLLDGHHKATAAALEGRPLKTLVLSTATHFNDEQQTLVFPSGECLHKTELQYHIPKLTACKTLPPSAWESFGPDKHISPSETWSEELKQSVSRYPSLDQAWQIVEAGNLSETRIKSMIQQGLGEDEKADIILQALFSTHSPLFIDFARFVISHPAYAI